MFCSLLTRCAIPCACHAKRHLNVQKWSEPHRLLHFWLQNVLRPTTACTFSTSQLPKMVQDGQFLTLLTWKCALRHSPVHFLNISTSKSAPTLVCFAHVDLKNVLRATTAQTFSRCQLPKVLRPWFWSTFWLPNVLRATRARNSSSLIWPAGSAPAALASLLFDPPESQNIGKHSESRLSYLFAHLHLLSSHSFSSVIISLLLFSSLTRPTSAFPTVHIVGNFMTKLSKLPSINRATPMPTDSHVMVHRNYHHFGVLGGL